MPTTTTGNATNFITFSRGSLATVTDADGRIKWAPHNLLLASEQFDAASWTKSNATVAANAEAAPNGTTTADTLTTSNTGHIVTQSASVTPGSAYVFSFWAKRGTMTDVKYSVFDNTNAANIVAATSYYSAINASTFTLVTVTFTAPAGCTSVAVYTLRDSGVTGTVHLWGASLTRADLGGMQSNPSAYPYYNPSTPRNLLGYSEDWSNAAWTKSSVAVTANAIAAPNGSLTADLLKEDVGSAWHSAYQGATTAASGTYTLSVYLKSGGRQYANLSIGSGTATTAWASITADLTGGTITSNQAGATGTYVSSAITSAGDGWYRVSMVGKIGSNTDAVFSVALSDVANPSRGNYAVYSYAGNGTSGIYLWGAQLSDSASLDPYVPSFGAAPSAAAAHGARLDYTSAGVARGLLVEEARTNLLQRSEEFDNTTIWQNLIFGTATNAVRTANAATSPDGTLNADRLQLTLNGGTATSDGIRVRQSVTTTAASHTFSVWLRSYDGVSTYTMGLQAQTAGTITVTGQWQRFSITTTTLAAATGIDIFLRGGQTPAHSDSVDILAWGAQLEAGSFATSYIPNKDTVAGVTRNADVASVGVSQFPYSQSTGSIIVSGVGFGGTGYKPLVVPRNTATTLSDRNPDMSIGSGAGGAAGGISRVDAVRSGSVIAGLGTTTGSYADNTNYKVAYAYATSDYVTVVNGGTANAQASGGDPPTGINRFDIGNRNSGSFLNGWIRQITYLPRRLTNSELQQRTA